ncbi:hypothetical protein KJJ36_14155 [Staphylococcus pseudoxylosus]|uniref:hypothetical protein n=1 Tax=Staphylococcus pseudoxylosus TaxID=2282419 RepID=UPI001F410B3F|nr:hypothetical protein [Staphylococcus pseudoxylosus]MCE5003511.1 hypothetical protein [Staphylococcus pseudoxylosus]
MKYKKLILDEHFTNVGLTNSCSNDWEKGELTLGSSSIPADDINYGEEYFHHNIPFVINKNKYNQDNFELEGQTINTDEEQIKAMHFLSCSCYGDYIFKLYINDSIEKEVHTKDFISYSIEKNEKISYLDRWKTFPYMNTLNGQNKNQPTIIWYSKINFDSPIKLEKIKFEDIPMVHIFSITLEKG